MGASPLLRARTAGVCYLISIVLGIYAEAVVRGHLIVSGDAAATARNIMASESLYRLGFAADLIGIAAYIVVTLLLYDLLKPVNARLSLLAAFFGLVGNAIVAASTLGHIAPLLLLGGGHYLATLSPAQLQAMAYLSLRLHGQGYLIALVFFGFYCAVVGYLIFRSTFFPRTVGVLMMVAGLCWLITTFGNFIAPAFADAVSSFTSLGTLAGEGSLMLWLLVMGVNTKKWNEAAAAAAS
jgi:hypothetical protein